HRPTARPAGPSHRDCSAGRSSAWWALPRPVGSLRHRETTEPSATGVHTGKCGINEVTDIENEQCRLHPSGRTPADLPVGAIASGVRRARPPAAESSLTALDDWGWRAQRRTHENVRAVRPGRRAGGLLVN